MVERKVLCLQQFPSSVYACMNSYLNLTFFYSIILQYLHNFMHLLKAWQDKMYWLLYIVVNCVYNYSDGTCTWFEESFVISGLRTAQRIELTVGPTELKC